MIKRKKNNTNTTLRATIMNGKSMTPQMVQNETDKEVYNTRSLKLWNLDAIQNGLNTRGISVTEVLIYVPEFNGISENESVAATETRHNQNQINVLYLHVYFNMVFCLMVVLILLNKTLQVIKPLLKLILILSMKGYNNTTTTTNG